MKIGMDASSIILRKTGIGHFAFNISNILEKNKAIDFKKYYAYLLANPNGDLNTPSRVLWETVQLPFSANKDKVDILYTPGFSISAKNPLFKFKRIVTVHDIIGKIFPENNGGLAKHYWQTWLPMMVKSADFIFASSENTKKDLLSIGTNEKKIKVIYPAVHFYNSNISFNEDDLAEYNITKPYFIAVGTLEYRKNYLNMIKASEMILKKFPYYKLVIVGKDGGQEANLIKYIEEQRLSDKVILIKYIGNELLLTLYKNAFGYITTSLYEGFGLPLLEAMTLGLSGVSSYASSLPEVGGEAVCYCDPRSVLSISDAIEEYITNNVLRERLKKSALEQASKFSFEKTANEMIECFKGVL